MRASRPLNELIIDLPLPLLRLPRALQDSLFEGDELIAGVAFGVDQGLLAVERGGHLGGLGFGDFEEVAVDLVAGELDGRDARLLLDRFQVVRQQLLAASLQGPFLIQTAVIAVEDHPPLLEGTLEAIIDGAVYGLGEGDEGHQLILCDGWVEQCTVACLHDGEERLDRDADTHQILGQVPAHADAAREALKVERLLEVGADPVQLRLVAHEEGDPLLAGKDLLQVGERARHPPLELARAHAGAAPVDGGEEGEARRSIHLVGEELEAAPARLVDPQVPVLIDEGVAVEVGETGARRLAQVPDQGTAGCNDLLIA